MLPLELINELNNRIPEYSQKGCIHISSLRTAFEIVGLNLSEQELSIIEKNLSNSTELDLKSFEEILLVLKKDSIVNHVFAQMNVFQENEDLKAYSTNDDYDTRHTVSSAEERGYSEWINKLLEDDPDLKNKYLPFDNMNQDIYNKSKDGLLLCKLINKAVPNTIDERAINKGDSLNNIFKKQENLVLAINSAASIGCCVVNVGPGDISDGTKHIMLGLIWQVIRSGLLGQINLVFNPNLTALLITGESVEDLKKLSPEELLIRWVNYQLQNSGCDIRIRNFKDDVMNCEAYIYLLNQIAPPEKRSLLISPEDILKVSDPIKRAELVLKNAAVLNSKVFVSTEDITNANVKGKNRDKLNLAFTANLFNTYPALAETKIEVPIDIQDETLEERTYRNWINSQGILSHVNSFYYDTTNGLVFLYIFDKLNPGCVDWSKVVIKFDFKRKLFQEQGNCNEAIEAGKRCNLKLQNISGENIRNGDKVYILGLCFQMMRYNSIMVLEKLCGNGRKIEDKDILNWVNNKLKEAGKTSQISSFKDSKIATSIPVIDLIDAIRPGSIQYNLVGWDQQKDSSYAVTMARKIGAIAYVLPDHLINLNQKMIITLFAALMAVGLEKN